MKVYYLKYKMQKYCSGNSTSYYRKPKECISIFYTTKKEVIDLINELQDINKLPNNNIYSDFEIIEEVVNI